CMYSKAYNSYMNNYVRSRINMFYICCIFLVSISLNNPKKQKKQITSFTYIEPRGDTVSQTLQNAATKTSPYLTYLAHFSYTINRDGSLNAPPLDNLDEIAAANNTSLALAVTNLENGAFSAELGHIILTVQAVQNTLLDNIVNTAETMGYQDVHFDLELLPPEDKEAYNNFLRKAKERLSQAGLFMSTALAPKTSAKQEGAWYEAHDYAAHGEIADFV